MSEQMFPVKLSKIPYLTARERTVCDHITLGLRNKEIAKVLHISPRTVENHRRSIFGKYGVDNAAALTRAVLLPQREETANG